MADGKIEFSVELDAADAERELSAIKKKILKDEAELSVRGARKLALEEELRAAGAAATEAKSRLQSLIDERDRLKADFSAGELTYEEFLTAGDRIKEMDAAIKAQQETVKGLEKSYDVAAAAVKKSDDEINKTSDDLKAQQALYGELSQEAEAMSASVATLPDHVSESGTAADDAAKSFAKFSNSTKRLADEVAKRFDKLTNRIAGLAKRVFVFTLVTRALRSLRDGLWESVKANEDASAALAKLKGALLTMVQPIKTYVLPIITDFINLLAQLASTAARIVSKIFGTSVQDSAQAAEAAQNLKAEEKAISGVGGAAKKASKQLLEFDEIQKLNSEDAGGAGGGGATADTGNALDFSGVTDAIAPRLKELLEYVLLIGAGLSLWKISEKLPGILGQIGTTIAGIAIAVGGVLLLWDGLQDAWNNGVDWGNLIEMLTGLAVAAAGLYIALGPLAAGIALIVGGLALLAVGVKDLLENGANLQNVLTIIAGAAALAIGLGIALGQVAAGISLIVTGLTMLVLGIQDAIENGMNLSNTLLMIAGILATGLGISLLTGNFIPLLISGIGAALVALVNFTGHGEELMGGLQNVFDGFVTFIAGVFSGDMEQAMEGLKQMWEGLKQVGTAIIDALKDAWGAFSGWLSEKFETAWNKVKEIWNPVAGWFNENVIEPIKQFFEPAVNFISSLFEGCWLIIEAVWSIVSGYFDEHVIGPIKEMFQAFWDACKDDVYQAWEDIKIIISAVAGFIEDNIITPVKTMFTALINGIITFVENGINGIIDAINAFLSGFNAIATAAGKIVGKDYSGVGVLDHVSLPRVPALAAGAVIPPNREFMAVLGDQSSGNNIEAPEALLRQMAQEAASANTAKLDRIIRLMESGRVLMVNDQTFAELSYKSYNNAADRHGESLVSVTGRA